MPVSSKRPNGFPRAAWAALVTEEQASAVRRLWTAAPKHNEAMAYQVIAETTGRAVDEMWQAKPARPARPPTAIRVTINCDGLCEPVNPGGTATYGFVARRGPELLVEDCGVVAKGHGATNNLAEYTAVLKALEWSIEALAPCEAVTIRTDSQLVVNQVNGEWSVKSPKIWPLHQRACSLLAKLRQGRGVQLEWVPRERNAEADRLTRLAYARADEEGQAARAERAKGLAGSVEATDDPGRYRVRSSSGRGCYTVDLGRGTCTCPDFAHRQAECKHFIAVMQATGSSA
jgi:ribonuclease HI